MVLFNWFREIVYQARSGITDIKRPEPFNSRAKMTSHLAIVTESGLVTGSAHRDSMGYTMLGILKPMSVVLITFRHRADAPKQLGLIERVVKRIVIVGQLGM